ncbi:hypothetical protein O3Q51_08290 [Cryomorphaceae bacterium 1068]|nr:hypothetical protein [Cryomorphaceae bacterium 1068]
MKRVLRLAVIVIGLSTFSSCAIHTGYMNNSASLSQANFSYTQTSISGTASTLKVFGFGGLAKSALVDDAKKDMLENHPLQSNQALANITVNWKTGFFIFAQNHQCTITADIVEFN